MPSGNTLVRSCFICYGFSSQSHSLGTMTVPVTECSQCSTCSYGRDKGFQMKRQTRCDSAQQDNKKISLTWAIRKSQLEIIGFLYFKRHNPETWAPEGECERSGFIMRNKRAKVTGLPNRARRCACHGQRDLTPTRLLKWNCEFNSCKLGVLTNYR